MKSAKSCIESLTHSLTPTHRPLITSHSMTSNATAFILSLGSEGRTDQVYVTFLEYGAPKRSFMPHYLKKNYSVA